MNSSGGETEDGVAPAELCVVGDADQSIYAFRGATIRNIEDFERDFPNATTILLEQNYRSTQNILNAANSVISRNAGRREKRLWTDEGEGELIVGYVADNEHDEARFVAGEIDSLADQGGITYNDVAVFYRTNNSSRALEEVFIRAGIPYKVVGGVRFYERREIRDIVAYLRVLDNPGDSVSMRRILNTPRRGIGDRAEACVAVYAENTGASFNDALQAAAEGKVPMLNTRSEKCIASFVEMIDDLRGRSMTSSAMSSKPCWTAPATAPSWRTPATHRIWRGWTTSTNWSASHTNSAPTWPTPRPSMSRTDEDIPDTGVLAKFLERVSLVADADELPEHGAGVVTMMTLHTAKGLEFPVVFVTGWEDGMFPHMRALGDPTELSEERRLAYVGITRARQRLYVSRAKVRSSWGQPMLNPESRFLKEIPQHLIDWRRTDPTPSFSAPGQRGGAVRHAAAVTGAVVGREAPAAGARAGRPRHPRQVRAGPRRRGLRRRRIRDVADRLRQRGAGQADAQPRAGRPSSRACAHRRVAGSSDQQDAGQRQHRDGVDDRRQLRARDEQAREDQQRDDRTHHDQQPAHPPTQQKRDQPPDGGRRGDRGEKADGHAEQPVGPPPSGDQVGGDDGGRPAGQDAHDGRCDRHPRIGRGRPWRSHSGRAWPAVCSWSAAPRWPRESRRSDGDG